MTKNDVKFGTTIYKGRSCDACERSGYKGRTGISMNRTKRGFLLKGATTEETKGRSR